VQQNNEYFIETKIDQVLEADLDKEKPDEIVLFAPKTSRECTFGQKAQGSRVRNHS